jgi:hypothetical protein
VIDFFDTPIYHFRFVGVRQCLIEIAIGIGIDIDIEQQSESITIPIAIPIWIMIRDPMGWL